MPAETQHPLPDDGSPGGSGHPAAGAAGHPARSTPGCPDGPGHPVPRTPAPHAPASRTPAPFTPASRTDTPVTAGADAPDLDEIVDWETGAPPREDDPYRSYCEEGEPRDGDEWPEESYLLAAPGDPGPERFAADGTADAMAPGPVLAILADRIERDGLEELDDDQLTGVLQAAGRLASWSAALKLAATSRLAARREEDGNKSGDWRPFDHVDDEVAVALTLTRRSAGRLLELALGLDRLPLTRAALYAGQIDERRAEVITDELAGLDDAHAAAVEKLIIGKAPRLTTGQLRALVRRAVLAADPAAARRRKEQALKDARVETFTEHAGTAALSGRDLAPADVLAADKHLTALAQAMKAAGITGTLDVLRASAYLHLLSGQPASTLLDPAPRPATRPDGGTGPHFPPAPAAPGSAGPGGYPPGSTHPPGASPGLRGTVNLTMPLSAWLGWTQSPGEVPGFGPLDADDSRTLADMLSRNPANQWCVTLTDPAGHPVAHACASREPGTAPGHQIRPSPGTPPGPGHHLAPAPSRTR